MSATIRLLAGLCALALVAVPAAAQNYRQVAPPAPQVPPPPTLAAPPAPKLAGGNTRVIIPTLRGIRLLGAAADVVPAGVARPGVTGTGVAFASELAGVLAPYLGHPASFATLRAIEAAITGVYRAKSHPFVNVVLPRQSVASGVVQIVVDEYRVDAVTVRGNRWFRSVPIREAVRIAPGDTINLDRLAGDLDWLNRNPFRQVDLLASPGGAPGTTDLNLVVHDRFPLAATLGYDNSGNATTGFDRWKLGFLAGDPFWTGGTLGYQFTTSDDFLRTPDPVPGGGGGPRFVAHSLDMTIPLPWRDTLRIFGDYERVAPSLAQPFDTVGHSGQASIRYIVQLPGWLGLVQRISLGYDFKSSDNNLDFGGTSVSAASTEIDQFPIIYSASLPDRYGETTLIPRVVLSPGRLSAGNTSAAFQPGATASGVAYARADYVYARIDAVRLTRLPAGFAWRMRLSAQVSSANLLPSEQLIIGGLGSVRGYQTAIAGGSQGVVIGETLLGPPMRLLGRLGPNWLQDRFRPDVFWDYAHVFDRQQIPGTQPAIDLTSLGIGGHYMLGPSLDLKVQAGTQFHPAPGSVHTGGFVNVSVLMTL